VSNIKRRRKRDAKVEDKQDAKTCKMREIYPQQHNSAMSAFKTVRKSMNIDSCSAALTCATKSKPCSINSDNVENFFGGSDGPERS
jgi:hypothetical protein